MPKDIGGGTLRYSRHEWGAEGGRGRKARKNRDHCVEHTFAMDSPGADASVDTEMAVMRSVERYHRRQRGWRTIGYAEVATDSGRVYEGRGPGRQLAHARGLNRSAYGFGHMGHGNKRPRSNKAWRAGAALHRWYERRGWLTRGHRLTGHRDHSDKDCPGTEVPDEELERLRGDVAPPNRSSEVGGTMKKGDQGGHVERLQMKINQVLHSEARPEGHGCAVDGKFGRETKRYVKHVQDLAGNPVTGKVRWWDNDWLHDVAHLSMIHNREE